MAAHKQVVVAQFRGGHEPYRDRMIDLVQHAQRAGASVVLLPKCARGHDATTSIADWTFDPSLLVASGALEVTGKGLREHAVAARGGMEIEDFDDKAIRWCDAASFSVMAAISSTIAGVSKGATPVRSTRAPPRSGQSVLMLDAGHHPYSGRYHFNTLRCAARDAAALAGAPVGLVLASWQYSGAKVSCSWPQPERRTRWTRAVDRPSADIVDIVEIGLRCYPPSSRSETVRGRRSGSVRIGCPSARFA